MDLEIKVLWCKGLTAFNFFQKLSIYTNVSIKHEDDRIELTQQQKQEQKTPVDDQGDGNPEWNHTIKFDLRPLETIGSNFHDLSVLFEFRHQGQLFGDKAVGEVRVPLRSLTESVGFDVVRFVSYEVRSPEGKHNGILDFSYKVFRNDHNSENHHINNSTQHLDWHNNHNHSHTSHVHNDHGQIVHHHHQHYQLDQQSSFDSEKIEYPKIDLEDWSANNYSTMSTNISHYPPPPPVVYTPPHQQYQWSPPPHFPPPPPPPVVYPSPQYGDPHWGYYRPPPGNNQQNGYHHW